ncbi:endo-1,3 1,4-beta-D-glucanase-like [Olea europaea subsp. europaea]|uniref:Endo-1,3 1,4-beta-D-glucanase-like n=1 Tax=Olea europaea subsp. europaea TaxID=158383 RepID=A0A8S0UTI5_OLEEU|nr:endo-1,3 1,4-beta-D-glucanase-like [Olea europaea subsp. europaea]
MSGPHSQCCENPPTLGSSTGIGHVEELGGLKCYISGSAGSKLAVILVSDVFGYEAPNLRKLADKVAAAGFYTVVPDFLNGDPYEPENVDRPFQIWIKDHGPDQGFEDAKPVIEALKSKGIEKIGAAGFCWGAKYAYIQDAVILQPSFVSLEDIQGKAYGLRFQFSILGAETDHRSPPELLKEFDATLNAKPEIDAFVKVFPGVSHGWSVRYKDDDEAAVKRAEEAHKDMLDWFIQSPPELLKEFDATLNAKPEIDAFVKVFPGVSHGWSVRYKDDDEAAVKRAEEAHKDMLDWFIQ